MYMRRRRKAGDPVFRAPESFGLAQLHLLRAEAFFQLVSFRRLITYNYKVKPLIKTAFLRELEATGNYFTVTVIVYAT